MKAFICLACVLPIAPFVTLIMPVSSHAAAFDYPKPPTSDQVDDYHGTRVADPYRPLEDANAPATQAWVEAENKVTFDYLRHIPAREGIHTRVAKLWDYEKFGIPEKTAAGISSRRTAASKTRA